MRIYKPDPITFTSYQSPLKTTFKKGLLGDDVIGIYGNRITKDNVSLEHIQPVSKNGKTILSNLVLADRKANYERGNKDIAQFVTIGMIRQYLKQFKNIKCKGFNGNEYIKLIRNTFNKMIEKE